MADREESIAARRGPLALFLNGIERVGNRLPDPLVLFVVMAALVPLGSALAAWSGWEKAHPVTGEAVVPVNLLAPEWLVRMLTDAVTNFTGFPPLGVVLVAMIGIGVAERSGFVAACLRSFIARVPRFAVSGSLVLGGVLANVAMDAGYVVLVPLGAVVFASVGRHPVAGIAAAFAGVSGGFSANLIITSLDPLLAGFTESAARLYDPAVSVLPTANFYFMVASTFVIVAAGWWVTERVVEPRLGRWTGSHTEESPPAHPAEKRALAAALGSVVLGCLVIALLVVPSGSLLRDDGGGLGPFYDSLIPLLAVLFVLPGLVFGRMTGRIRTSGDVASMMGDSMAAMGGYIVLAFFAAQFIAYFQWSNLGLLIALTGADLLESTGAGPVPLMLGIVVLSGIVNLFIGSASAKWGLTAPVLVPMMMSLGFSPELAQAAFRIGDSTTNIITPLLPYFPIILSFARKYQPDIQLGTLISLMLPYSLAFGTVWSLQLVAWHLLELPLGPGAGIMLP